MSYLKRELAALDREVAALEELADVSDSAWEREALARGYAEGQMGTRSAALRDAWRICYESRDRREECAVVHAELMGNPWASRC